MGGGGYSISMQTFLASNQKKARGLAEEGRRLGTGRLSISPSLTSASHLLVSLLRHLLSLFLVLRMEGSLLSLTSLCLEPQSSLALANDQGTGVKGRVMY